MKLPVFALCSVALLAQEAAPFRIQGRVMDLEGHPLARAEITLKAGPGPGFTCWSDGEGRFALRTTSRGYLTLQVEASARQTAYLSMLQVPGGESNPEFRLALIPWVEPKEGALPLWGTLDGQSLPGGSRLTPRGDGTWVAELAGREGSVFKGSVSLGGYVIHPGHTADRFMLSGLTGE